MPSLPIEDPELEARLRERARELNMSQQEAVRFALQRFVAEPIENMYFAVSKAVPTGHRFTFIDLFAGIGGIRLAFEEHGGYCVFSSEWDKWSQATYRANFGEQPHGDITQIDPNTIPDHDVLTAGFPCQPFSIAGVTKKKSLGREHGFKDETQGTLFFNVASIIEAKRPRMFMLENVKNLMSHDRGNTFKVIRRALEELGYVIFAQVIDARNYVPQHRERIFIVGFDRSVFGDSVDFSFPTAPTKEPTMKSILLKERDVDARYRLSDHLWQYLQDYAAKHKERGNGFGFGLVTPNSVARTLSARYHKDGAEILVSVPDGNPRRLTPRECARLMGFPDSFIIDKVSDTQAYRQFGNSVVVPVVSAVAREMLKTYESYFEEGRRGGRVLEGKAKRGNVKDPWQGH